MTTPVQSTLNHGSGGLPNEELARHQHSSAHRTTRRSSSRTPRSRLRGGDALTGARPAAPGHAGARSLGLWTQISRSKLLCLPLALLLVLQQVFFPACVAVAEPNEVTINSYAPGPNEPQPVSFQASNGAQAYCLNYEKTMPGRGQAYKPARTATGGIGYIALHGYNNTTYIEGEELTQSEALAATQYAYWVYNGSLDRNGALLVPANGYPVGYVPNLRTRSEKAWQAGLRLVDAAKAFEADPSRNTPDAPENTSSTVYVQSDGGTKNQEMLLVTVVAGSISFSKDSNDPRTIRPRNDSTSQYGLGNAIYKIWRDKDCTIDTGVLIRTDNDGRGRLYRVEYGVYYFASLPVGTYYVRESQAPKGYELDDTVYPVEIKRDQVSLLTPTGESLHETPQEHTLTLQKSTGNQTITEGNQLYSLEGAVYGVWDTETGAKNLEDVALAETPNTLDGYWFLVQSTANSTYSLDADTTGSNSVTLEHFSAREQQKWLLAKNEDGTYSLKNGATGTYLSVGEKSEAATSANAKDSHWRLDVKNDNTYALVAGDGAALAPETNAVAPGTKVAVTGDASTQKGQWYLRRASSFQGCITTDAQGTGSLSLPDHAYYLREIKAPTGYQLDTTVYSASLSGEDATVATKDEPLTAAVDTVAIKTSNNGEHEKKYLPGAEFTVNYYAGSYESTDELPATPTRSWVLRTDDRGVASLANAQVNPSAYLVSGDDLYLDAQGKAVLPLGTVTLRESKAPEGYLLSDNQVHLQRITPATKEDGTPEVAEFSPVEVSDEEEKKDEDVTLATTLVNKLTGLHTVTPREQAKLVDTVSYTGLTRGKEYELKATLVNKENGKPLVIGGTVVTASVKFSPSGSSGTEQVEFECDTSMLQGKTVVAFERLLTDGEEIASHADINDADQTVEFTNPGPTPQKPNPSIKTSARDSSTKEAVATGRANDTLLDTVSYAGLTPGDHYTLTTTLHIRNSEGKDLGAAKDVQGNELVSTRDFTPETAAGTIETNLSLDTSSYAGLSLVFFEELAQQGNVVARHQNIADEAQTVRVPSIATHVHSIAGGSEVPMSSAAKFSDDATFANLLPGKVYTLTGTLMNPKTHEPIKQNGKAVTASTTFTPSHDSGMQTVEFQADTTSLAGNSAVVFETLSMGSQVVATHEDFNDENQTIQVPQIATTLVNSVSNEHTASSDASLTLVDHVSFTNLVPHTEYVLQGTLMDKSTGIAALDDQGKEITASVTFTPETPNGTQDVDFSFNASSLAGKELVAFETLLRNGEIICSHNNLNDADQTISIEARPVPDTPSEVTPEDTPDTTPPSVTPKTPTSPEPVHPAEVSTPKLALPSTGDQRLDVCALVAIVGTICLVMAKLEFPSQRRKRRR